MKTRLLVVGWDAADWGLVHPLLDAGKLPNLLRLVETGGAGTLTGLIPATVPIVWTSLATGRFPEHHRVLAEFERRPDRGGVQEIGRRSWRAPSFWEMLSAAGLDTAIVNWPATSPADLWPCIVIDDSFATPHARDFETWALAPHCVSPPSWRADMTDLRVHPREIAISDLAGLVPRAAEIDPRSDSRLARLAVSLARTASFHAAATHLAESASWDVLAVRYTLLADAASDIAAKPRGADLNAEHFAGVIEAVYRFFDSMLGRLLTLAGAGTRVLLIAPFTQPPAAASGADPFFSRRGQGMIIAAGPGCVPDAIVQGSTIYDVCPTILGSFGLAAESDGRALPGIFASATQDLRSMALPPAKEEPREDPAGPLFALGYLETFNAGETLAIAKAQTTAAMNLADSFLARGEWRKAAASYEAVLLRQPDDYDANVKLCHALLQIPDVEAARPIAETVLAMAPNLPWGDLLLAIVLILEGQTARAEDHMRRARQLGADVRGIALRIGWVNLLIDRASDSEAAFREALAKDHGSAEAHTGLGIALAAQDRNEEAEQTLKRAIALEFHNPLAHLYLGQMLAQGDNDSEALKVLRTALAQAPQSAEAKSALAGIERKLAGEMIKQAAAKRGASRTV